jgi:hypothetical protein
MWSEPQLDELFSGGVLRVLVNPWLFSLVCRVNCMVNMERRVDAERTAARSAVLRWRLESSVHPMVIFRCM